MALERGFSGFHKITLTVTKVFCKKQISNIVRYRTSNIVRYRSHKNFNSEMFLNELYYKISELNSESEHSMLEIFTKKLRMILFKSMLPKKGSVSENEAPFINKKISKEINKRTRLV